MKWSYFYVAAIGLFALPWQPGTALVYSQENAPRRQPATSGLEFGQIDTATSRTFARVDKTGLGHEHAIEGRVKAGRILLGAPQNAGVILFDMTSFRADTPVARKYIGLSGSTSASTQKQVNTNMLGDHILHVTKYPTATFAIDSAIPTQASGRDGHPLYKLTGNFTLHGMTRPLQIDAEVLDEGNRSHLRGGFTIQQTHFGITPYSTAFGTIGVADAMTIYGEIYIAKASNVAREPQLQR